VESSVSGDPFQVTNFISQFWRVPPLAY
jgi:hypothetical protein